MELDLKTLQELVDALPQALANDLQQDLSKYFDRCGLYYRIFSRCKSGESASRKIEFKGYPENGKKMQDLIGVRAALYFRDDVDMCVQMINNLYDVVETVQDREASDTFRPVRLNMVCKLPDKIVDEIDSRIWDFPIDPTFEIQVRTMFSEGWHEVEHDLRYKNKKDWLPHEELDRTLNGIFATLETCDWVILQILEQLSYQKYKAHDWEAMLRSHFRLRVGNSELRPEMMELFTKNQEIAKGIYRADRRELLLYRSHKDTYPLPVNLNNIVYLINALFIKDEDILRITPDVLRRQIAVYTT